MAFDSTGLAGKAQNRLHDTPWCRINKETEPKKQQRILEMKQIKEMQKENASLTTNHKHTTEL